MDVILIVAATRNRVIGKDNDLIWHLPVDMRYFRETTMGHPVIMGRRNYESIPKKYRPLAGRLNIVLSNQRDFGVDDGVWLRNDLRAVIQELENQGEDKVFVIGGGQIYKVALELDIVDRMLITWVDATLEGDTYFPEVEGERWEESILMKHPTDEKHAYSMTFSEYNPK